MRDTRALASLVVACAAHILLAVVVRPGPAPSPNNDAMAEREIDLTVLDAPEKSTEPPEAERTSPAAASASSSAKAKEIARGRSPAASSAPSDSEAMPTLEPSAPAQKEGTWSFQAQGPIDLGIGKGAQLSSAELKSAGRPSESESPGAAPAPASSTGGLIESLDAQDVARGFGRGGPARTAAEMATRDAAVMGSAIFAVKIDVQLNVTVELANVSSDYPGWARVAEDIKRTIVAKNVRMPHGAKGLRISVRVEAKDQYPDGRNPKSVGGYAGAGGVGYSGKVCSAGIVGIGIGGGCSPENIGAPAVRIVSARIVAESRL
ncbi:MAG: hypothetical protein ABIP39_10650 [Polyangiaceae bacterium]